MSRSETKEPAAGAGSTQEKKHNSFSNKNITQMAGDFKAYTLHDVFMHLRAGTVKTALWLLPLLDNTEYQANREKIAELANVSISELDKIHSKNTEIAAIKKAAINAEIAKTREKLHLAPEQWQNFAIFNARIALDSAPDHVRALFIGNPSQTPRNVLLLAEIFTRLFLRAEDAATAANLEYFYAFLWDEALAIWGGING